MITLERREYCKRLLDIYPDVPICVAAAALGVSRNTFAERFIETGIVTSIIKPGSKRRTVLSADIKNVDEKLRAECKVIPKSKIKKVSKSSLLEHFDVIAEKIYKEIGWAQ